MPGRTKLLADLRMAVAIEDSHSNWTQADKAREARNFIRDHGPALIEMAKREGEAGGKRTETGPLKIGDDWTGYFLRGDTAMGVSITLEHMARMTEPLSPLQRSWCAEWAKRLMSCREGGQSTEAT